MSDQEEALWITEIRDDKPYETNFELSIKLGKPEPSGFRACSSASYFVELIKPCHGGTRTVEVDRTLFNELLILKQAGELRAIRELIEDTVKGEDGMLHYLGRIAAGVR